MSDLIVNTTDTDFDQDVLQSDVPVLVDFGRLGVVHVKSYCAYFRRTGD